MPKYPRDLPGSAIIRALQRMGFEVIFQKGSHVRLRRETSLVTVPRHKAVRVGTLAEILRQADITLDELLNKL